MTEAIEALLAGARRAREEGRASDSRDGYARSAALSREAGLPLLQAHALRHLSDIDREAGHASEALAHAEQAASVYRANGPPLDLANALRLKALALDDLRRLDRGARPLRRCGSRRGSRRVRGAAGSSQSGMTAGEGLVTLAASLQGARAMSRRLALLSVATGVIALAACDQPRSAGPATAPAPTVPATKITPTAAADLPDAVRAAVLAGRPGMLIAEAELKEREGRRYYDVEGTVDGADIELDLLETPSGWQVVEIQRDLPWSAVPAAVRAAAETARAGFVPVRVIESVQADGGAVIYELFADGRPATPALEVRVADGRAEVLKEAWPH